ncbi:MAG: tRNA(5-methylaminomethyl-2-thiouridylate) methyltransferase [Desulfovibrio sp.]|jgi:hypothetical protein|nr:tRNA(5-methylaminomethyl-2-thiouridylate) methyltransferase [Desulfovibrio sp.]
MSKATGRAAVLLSGGLDSLLSAKVLQEQGLDVTCLHFITPFFGKPHKLEHWRSTYGLNIRPVDVGEEFIALLKTPPPHGFGSVLNPCVDCKILMLRRAKSIMEELGACCVATGEVLGQRPMSQRRDALNIIRRDADLKDFLLRPLTALHLEPTRAEREGIVDRSRLYGFYGRSRKMQMDLAARFGITEIPTPAGGCRLTEHGNARSYYPILLHSPAPQAADFYLGNAGRQLWHIPDGNGPDGKGPVFRLIVGRNATDNARLAALAGPRDLFFQSRDYPGPTALGRFFGEAWSPEAVASAAFVAAAYTGKAKIPARDSKTVMLVSKGSPDLPGTELEVDLRLPPPLKFAEYPWEKARAEIKTAAARQEALRKGPDKTAAAS